MLKVPLGAALEEAPGRAAGVLPSPALTGLSVPTSPVGGAQMVSEAPCRPVGLCPWGAPGGPAPWGPHRLPGLGGAEHVRTRRPTCTGRSCW